jgi:DNA modification methylase
MKLYAKEKSYELYNGDMLDMKEVIKDNSIDSIVCDPPYEINFMNKGWDNSGIAFNKEAWAKCCDVLKPGGYLLAFGGTRTYHRVACAIEDAGFEIRDCIMYLYGSGFPKSMNIGLAIDKKNGVKSEVISTIKTHDFSKHKGSMMSFANTNEQETSINKINIKKATNEWNGWGTALKPAYEPIIVARKPFKTSVTENIMQNGVGGINIDECRIPFENTTNPATNPLYRQQNKDKYKQIEKGQESNGAVNFTSSKNDISNLGRFPANVIHDESEEAIEAMGEASRYFYCAKTSRKDRDEGLELEFSEVKTIRANKETAREFGANSSLRRNIHPTVKPTELMQYLVRLVSPSGATILDPFMGSGSTGKAVMFENRERNADYKFIGIELTDKYLPIAKARIDYALNQYEYDAKEKEIKTGQMSLFDYKEK